MPPARHPPPASATLTSLNPHRSSSLLPFPVLTTCLSPLSPSSTLSSRSLLTSLSSLLPHSSPPRPKIRPKLSLASPNPLWGFGLARDSSPFTPAQITPSGPRFSPKTSRRQNTPAAPPSSRRPQPGSSLRPAPQNDAKKHPAAPQEFFGKNSYARKPAPFRPANHPPLYRAKPCIPQRHDQR